MLVFNLVVFIYLGLAFLAPTLMKTGNPGIAGLLYKGYGFVCHQLAYRSFFLFGEQPYYPRQAASLSGVMTFSEATGMDESNTARSIFAARNYVGDEQVGYKVALCERDIAIYAGILIFGLLFSLSGMRLRSIPWLSGCLWQLYPLAWTGSASCSASHHWAFSLIVRAHLSCVS
jgi:uncharacterized membrane protein